MASTVDATGTRICEARIDENAPAAFAAYFKALAEESKVVIEACWNWGWLYDLLREVDGIKDVVLAHPFKTRLIADAQIKNDRLDARALATLLIHEPDVILPRLIFGEMDRILFTAGDFAAPFFARWLSPDEASRAAEWAVRIVLAYLADPAPGTDLSDPGDTRALVRAFVMPGILALRSASTAAASTASDLPTNAKKGAVP